MANRLGMKISEMEALHKLVKNDISKVDSVIRALDKQVQSVDWRGKDASHFKSTEWNDAKRNLKNVITTLQETERKLKSNIGEQRRVSNK